MIVGLMLITIGAFTGQAWMVVLGLFCMFLTLVVD